MNSLNKLTLSAAIAFGATDCVDAPEGPAEVAQASSDEVADFTTGFVRGISELSRDLTEAQCISVLEALNEHQGGLMSSSNRADVHAVIDYLCLGIDRITADDDNDGLGNRIDNN